MATGLGLRVGTYESVAAVVTSDDAEPEYIVRDSVLYLTDDGDSQLGGTPPDAPTQAISGFLERVGDPDGITVDGGGAYRPEDLVATAMFCLIDAASPQITAPSEIFATYPAQWSSDAVDALRDSLDYLGLSSLNLMSEADAAVDSGDEPAHGAALAALAAVAASAPLAAVANAGVDDPATEEFPAAPPLVSGPMVIAPAYSALAEPPGHVPPVAAEEEEPAETGAAVVTPLARLRRKPVLLAASFGAVLALAAGIAAVALQYNEKAEAPQIPSVEAAPAPQPQAVVPTQQVALPPLDLPVENVAPIVEPVQVAEPIPVQAPPIVEAPIPVPPPVVEPPLPVVTEPPVTVPPTTPAPETTDPSTPTNPPTTEPERPTTDAGAPPRLANPFTDIFLSPGQSGR
ncbi:hypothetical protein [Antrihabitans sp. YC2-6]|uniref:hypothetical protein n=1 Tax=Antrihabitans sp. YC2-6 TaxID=2799498 RepID=UPI0018F58C17|nr:hypothetical protein [Antrihabitans sp. YC2-6]MBJ8348682.1 hypothetical protein [Antrihabitans sp. YC2-6]